MLGNGTEPNMNTSNRQRKTNKEQKGCVPMDAPDIPILTEI
jgi:hypothetical protein